MKASNRTKPEELWGGSKKQEDEIIKQISMGSEICQDWAAESFYLIFNHSLKVTPSKFAKFDNRKTENP